MDCKLLGFGTIAVHVGDEASIPQGHSGGGGVISIFMTPMSSVYRSVAKLMIFQLSVKPSNLSRVPVVK